MGRRLRIVFLLLVIVPATAVAMLGFRLWSHRAEQDAADAARRRSARLEELEGLVQATVQGVEARLLDRLAAVSPTADDLRALRRKEPLLAQVFVLDGRGRLTFPTSVSSPSVAEQEFADQTQIIWKGDAILYAPPVSEDTAWLKRRTDISSLQPQSADPSSLLGASKFRRRASGKDSIVAQAYRRSHGWITWYWKEGLHLLLWRRDERGGVIGGEVERVVLLSRIAGRLPYGERAEDRIRLVDSRGGAVVQWGRFEPPQGAAPQAMHRLAYPLDAWRFEYFEAPANGAAQAGWLGLGAGLVALVLALFGLAVYFYRESSREMAEAAQRVTFVTQVSHELKTPLSNIRLYAELLEDRLEDDDEAQSKLQVVVAECRRLTRLIENILAFARARRGALRIQARNIYVDDVIRTVSTQFAPALEVRGVSAEFDLNAPAVTFADPDAVEQILSNLISNVEKYGASGKRLFVQSAQTDSGTQIVVGDEGPGIPKRWRRRIFDPFERVSDRLTDGVTGTGIGLSIARQMARRLGGDLVLLDRQPGAWFELSLPRAKETHS